MLRPKSAKPAPTLLLQGYLDDAAEQASFLAAAAAAADQAHIPHKTYATWAEAAHAAGVPDINDTPLEITHILHLFVKVGAAGFCSACGGSASAHAAPVPAAARCPQAPTCPPPPRPRPPGRTAVVWLRLSSPPWALPTWTAKQTTWARTAEPWNLRRSGATGGLGWDGMGAGAAAAGVLPLCRQLYRHAARSRLADPPTQ